MLKFQRIVWGSLGPPCFFSISEQNGSAVSESVQIPKRVPNPESQTTLVSNQLYKFPFQRETVLPPPRRPLPRRRRRRRAWSTAPRRRRRRRRGCRRPSSAPSSRPSSSSWEGGRGELNCRLNLTLSLYQNQLDPAFVCLGFVFTLPTVPRHQQMIPSSGEV